MHGRHVCCSWSVMTHSLGSQGHLLFCSPIPQVIPWLIIRLTSLQKGTSEDCPLDSGTAQPVGLLLGPQTPQWPLLRSDRIMTILRHDTGSCGNLVTRSCCDTLGVVRDFTSLVGKGQEPGQASGSDAHECPKTCVWLGEWGGATHCPLHLQDLT